MPFTVHAPWKDWIFHIGLFHQWHLPCHGHTMVKKSKQGEIRKVYYVYPNTWYYPPSQAVPPMRQEMMTENMMMSEPMMEMMNMMNMMKQRYDDDE